MKRQTAHGNERPTARHRDNEVGVQAAICIHTRQPEARCSVHTGKHASDQHLAIGLDGQAVDRGFARCYAGREVRVHAAINVQAGHRTARHSIETRELASKEQFSIRLKRARPKPGIRPGHAIEEAWVHKPGLRPSARRMHERTEQEDDRAPNPRPRGTWKHRRLDEAGGFHSFLGALVAATR